MEGSEKMYSLATTDFVGISFWLATAINCHQKTLIVINNDYWLSSMSDEIWLNLGYVHRQIDGWT